MMLTAILASGPAARAETPPAGLGGFQAGDLITDEQMFDGDALTAAEVDAFLDRMGAA